MISSLELQNFKCFARLRLPLGALTLVTGFNGSGKSSAIQPLLLLSQWNASNQNYRGALNGRLVRLGTTGDVLPSDAESSNIVFTIEDNNRSFSWTLSARAGDQFLTVSDLRDSDIGRSDLSATSAQSGKSSGLVDMLHSLNKLTYISAVREGGADYFPIPHSDVLAYGNVGPDGRFAAYWYDRFVDDDVPERRRLKNEKGITVRKQLDAWIGTLFPGAQANVQSIPQVLLYCLQFRMSDTGAWRRPANVGYGFTYAFPILVALMVAEDGQIVVIDSPEAHLHPAAQSQMGQILAHFATSGVQIIVETHSDHLLNGVRIAVNKRQISPEALKIHFFTGPKKDEHGVISPQIDKSGRINEWPTGFFDQSEKDLSQLANW